MRVGLVIGFLVSFTCFSQSDVKVLLEDLPIDSIYSNSTELHTSVKPAIRYFQQQDNRHLIKFSIGKQKGKGKIGLNPLLDLNGRSNEGFFFRTGAGVQVESAFEKPWYFRLNAVGGVGQSDSLFEVRSWISQHNGEKFNYLDLTGRVSYTPNKVFNFQTGLDNNFIGEGCRSLFLSDYGKPYPFAQINARFWRVEYTTIYQFMREGQNNDFTSKFGATHHISLNATKWLNFGVFETVIFQPKDTALQRGFDVEYLNPVIFYRPQEYSLGSSDNVLLGASMHVKYKTHMFYLQLILDEFSLTEMKARSGWWANKFGGQVGIKGYLPNTGWKSFYRLEYNFLRPYTYAHLAAGQNYGNQGYSLAHPYGANMMELLGEWKAVKKNWQVKAFASYFLQGLDKDGYSYGGNVYLPYTQRPYEYDHHIGQGKGNNGIRLILTVSYSLLKQGDLQLFTEQQLRYDSAFSRTSYAPVIGIRSRFRNDHRNY